VSDVFLGCGLGSILVIGVLGFTGPALSQLIPASLLILGLTVPHYGATLLRVYEDKGDRLHYSFFSIWCSIAIALALVAGLQSVVIGSLILTLYLTWSPWHYSGQNYGIFLMLLVRRGVAVDPTTKRLIYASFVLSFLMTFLAIHGVDPSATYAPVTYQGTVFTSMSLGIPQPIAAAGLALAGIGYLGVVVAMIVSLLRTASLGAIAPSLVLAATQSLWFALPVAVRYWGPANPSEVFAASYTAYGFVWIAAFHSAQYLWITTYYGAASGPATARLRFVGKAAVAGYAVWTLPALIFGPSLLGSLPHENGLALLAAATVNLHHFVLDGAIWKLRDGRVARLLLTPRPTAIEKPASDDPATLVGGEAPWLRRVIYSVGVLCLLYGGVTFWEEEVGFKRALRERDMARAGLAVDRLAMLGRKSASRHRILGEAYANRGAPEVAIAEFQRSLEVYRSIDTLASLAKIRAHTQQWQLALDRYDELLEMEPHHAVALYRSGLALMKLTRPGEAIPRLELAANIAPEIREIRSALTRARVQAETKAGSHDDS
jgi:tetratricopeptide (TPR) repeat protein